MVDTATVTINAENIPIVQGDLARMHRIIHALYSLLTPEQKARFVELQREGGIL
jgi:Spy/CpxP family protein refolding chaperone